MQGNEIGAGSAEQFVELGQIACGACDDEFAAFVEGEALLADVGAESFVAIAAKSGLEGIGGVIESGVEDAAVAAAGVVTDLALLFEQDHRVGRVSSAEGPGDTEADDASAQDEKIGSA
jgi:hypothetical protein